MNLIFFDLCAEGTLNERVLTFYDEMMKIYFDENE